MNILVLTIAANLFLGMVAISGGEYRPLYISEESERTTVSPFLIDTMPVTNLQFLGFVQQANNWQKDGIPPLFAEGSYLSHWSEIDGVWQPHSSQNQEAVVNVSWFAARAYCRARGKRLPAIAEWEYVALASESHPDGSTHEDYNQRILDWYAKPIVNGNIGQTPANYWGVKDLHGLIWEWTEDFNSNLTSGESRADASVDTKLYCAAAGADSVDPSNYAAFMRYGLRSSLQARFTLSNLGFRCAKEMVDG